MEKVQWNSIDKKQNELKYSENYESSTLPDVCWGRKWLAVRKWFSELPSTSTSFTYLSSCHSLSFRLHRSWGKEREIFFQLAQVSIWNQSNDLHYIVFESGTLNGFMGVINHDCFPEFCFIQLSPAQMCVGWQMQLINHFALPNCDCATGFTNNYQHTAPILKTSSSMQCGYWKYIPYAQISSSTLAHENSKHKIW